MHVCVFVWLLWGNQYLMRSQDHKQIKCNKCLTGCCLTNSKGVRSLLHCLCACVCVFV